MKNIRIFAEDKKRCEVYWLGIFLTLCGCQVWNGRINDIEYFKGKTNNSPFLNVILFEKVDISICFLLDKNTSCKQFISGHLDKNKEDFLFDRWVCSPELNFEDEKSIYHLAKNIAPYIVDDVAEYNSMLKILKFFVLDNNALTKAIYVADELFCSRKIDYSSYQNYDVLLSAVNDIKKWYELFLENLDSKMTFVERYAITYIQNFLNNCFLKIRQSNGFNTDKLLNNASRLHEMKPTANATLFLKFQVIGSINALDKRFEETAQELLKASENEFKNRVYYELGDRFRETGINEAKTKTIQYYSKIDDANKEYYQGWYKLGLLYEEADMISLAIEQYEKIIKTIQNFEACYRTPQEFEFLFKSKYKLLKWKIKGFLNAYYASGESTVLKAQAKDLANDCMKIYPNYFLTKMYGENNETAGKIKELMIEKMTIVELWIKKMGN